MTFECRKAIVGRLVGLVALSIALVLAALITVFVLFFAGAFAPSRPWALAVFRGDQDMMVRIHYGSESQDWLMPGLDLEGPEVLFLALSARPAGPIELVDPGDCRIVARAQLPQTGRGVLVSYWFDGESEQWELNANVDTMLDEVRSGIASVPACRPGT